MLRLSKTSYIEYDNKLLVIGDAAISTANLFNKEARRPMADGLMSAGELDAQGVIAVMMKHLLGDPRCDSELCCYSIPAPALDIPKSDIIYHKAILGKILKELGYKPQAVNESLAIIYSECADDNFSGLAISFGAGMTNICLAYNAMSALEFSLARGGDSVDAGAAKAVGTTAAKICMIKETGIDISAPKGREEEAIALYLQALIDYSIDNIIKHFYKIKNEILIPKPIPLIISGGTSLAGGFIEKFKERFNIYKDRFPVAISEINGAKDPMTAVATGLLLYAQLED
jgi:hypothetical protein